MMRTPHTIMAKAERACIVVLLTDRRRVRSATLRSLRITKHAIIGGTAAVVLFAVSLLGAPALAQELNVESSESVVTYSVRFFDRYQPNTALDIVKQLPGFQLDDGDDRRGFGGSAGNVLINDRYPSVKKESPSRILARIPASQVARVELVRGQIRDIDLQGNAVVANLVLVNTGSAAMQWELGLRRNLEQSPLAPIGAISYSSRWRDVDFNLGVDARRAAYGDPGVESVFDVTGMQTEQRVDNHRGLGHNANVKFSASTLVGETQLQFNSSYGVVWRSEDLIASAVPLTPPGPTRTEVFDTRRDDTTFEIGVDAERQVSENLTGKAIVLFNQRDRVPFKVQRNLDNGGLQTLFRRVDTDATSKEAIVRFEFDWTPKDNHVYQFNLEAAENTLRSSLTQQVDIGAGLMFVPVPGANTRVEESRSDLLLSDIWTFGDYEMDYGLGAEASTISQSGDAIVKRSFFFVKPHISLTHSSSENRQLRLRVAREVSQLNFDDFVSATDFEDDDLALGNPNLKPETTWIAELSSEWQLGGLSVVKVSAFHHWISDVQDLLPISSSFEVPGNIGDGRRWGALLEATLPLDWSGLQGARLDLKARVQDSTVIDPVTGSRRVLSAQGGGDGEIEFRDENRWALHLDFRQDFDTAGWSWGWNTESRAERPLYKVNELDIYSEDTNVNVFVETNRWFGVKIRLSGLNLIDIVAARDRTVFSDERSLSPVSFRERRDLTNGKRILLTVSGTL